MRFTWIHKPWGFTNVQKPRKNSVNNFFIFSKVGILALVVIFLLVIIPSPWHPKFWTLPSIHPAWFWPSSFTKSPLRLWKLMYPQGTSSESYRDWHWSFVRVQFVGPAAVMQGLKNLQMTRDSSIRYVIFFPFLCECDYLFHDSHSLYVKIYVFISVNFQ